MKSLNQKGQAFEAYRVLIAMVIALAVLLIILSAISYFDALRQKVSQDTLYSSWKSAVDSPNGRVIRASNLSFNQDAQFSRTQFSKQVGLDQECVQLEGDADTGFDPQDIGGDTTYVRVTKNVIGNVYFQCRADNFIIPPGPASCFAYCVISFGKEIQGDV